MKSYRIKPLEWRSPFPRFYEAITDLADYTIEHTEGFIEPKDAFELTCCWKNEAYYSKHKSLELAKKKAEEDWKSRLKNYLIEV